jgi:predicted transposase YbfD/YdcC
MEMAEQPLGSISEYFGQLEDPRIERNKLHPLLNIIVIAICAVICGAENWVDVELYGNLKKEWLEKYLDLSNGIPSHDTFGRVFRRLKAEAFQACFLAWVKAVNTITGGQVIAIDGKELRRSMDTTLGKRAIHMVSAWASENRLVLAQQKVDEKSNEITAIPALLEMLEIAGCIITIDAMGCQTEIAQQITDQQGDYVLAVKENQGHLFEDIEHLCQLYLQHEQPMFYFNDYAKTVDKNHDRIEIRECWTLDAAFYGPSIRKIGEWAKIQTVVMIRRERRLSDKTEIHTRYYISSLKGTAKRFLQVIREHWGIENSVHWVLDMAFNEDQSRLHKDNGAENLAVIRHIALNLLRNEKTAKVGIKAKRLKAGWDDAYLFKVLSA